MTPGGLWRRLLATVGRRRRDRELEEEIQFHLDMEIERNLARGLRPDQARGQALRDFGGVAATRDDHRDARGLPWLEDLGRDVRLALRSIRRAPLFASAVILLLVLGIGAGTAVFSVVDGVLLKPLPYPRPGELVELVRANPHGAGPGHDWATVRLLRERAEADEPVAAVGWAKGLNLVAGETALYVRAQPVSFEYFAVMGVPPRLGRAFQAADERAGESKVVVLTHELAERLGGGPSLLGRTVLLSGRPHEVAGVMPPGYRTFPRVDLLVPYRPGTEASGTNTLALARTGRGSAIAARRLVASAAALRAAGTLDADTRLSWTSLHEGMNDFRRPTLLLLLAAVGLVMLVTCVNVAGLLLVRGQGRSAEMAVRAALGGGRGRLLRLLLTESLVLAFAGGVLGLLAAHAGLQLLLGLAPADLRDWTVGLDGRVLGFSLGLTAITGLAFGLAPAVHASRVDLRAALAGGATGTAAAPPPARWRRGLLAGEIALCTLLLLGAGLLGRTLLALRGVDSGFDPRGLLVLGMSPDASGEALQLRYAELLEQARAVPGVQAVALSSAVPGRRGLNLPMVAPSGEREAVAWRYVSPGTVEMLAIPVRRGRSLSDRDGAAAQPVALVNEAFVRRYFPDREALGQEVKLHAFVPEAADPPRTIVGVVGDTRDASLTRAPEPAIYVAVAQVPAALFQVAHRFFDPCLLVRTDLPPALAAARLGEVMRARDPGLPWAEVTPLERVLNGRLSSERFLTLLLGIFALVALVIATAGMYGITAYTVSRRTREIGVRLAFGAAPRMILASILGESMVVAAAGVGLGLLAAWPLRPLLSGFLYGAAGVDPGTALAVVVVLFAAAALASATPALRAARTDPAAILRES